MDKKIMLVAFMLIIMMSSVMAAGITYSFLELVSYSCKNNDGIIDFTVKNRKELPINTDDIKITVSGSAGQFTPPGKWSADMICGTSECSLKDAKFTSAAGAVKDPGNYVVLLEYPGCQDKPCAVQFDARECSGFPYDCNLSDPEIVECYDENYQFTMIITGINKGQVEKLDPIKDLYYDIRTMEGTPVDITKVNPITSEIADDIYKLTFSSKRIGRIQQATAGITACRDKLARMTCSIKNIADQNNLTSLNGSAIKEIVENRDDNISADGPTADEQTEENLPDEHAGEQDMAQTEEMLNDDTFVEAQPLQSRWQRIININATKVLAERLSRYVSGVVITTRHIAIAAGVFIVLVALYLIFTGKEDSEEAYKQAKRSDKDRPSMPKPPEAPKKEF